MSKEQTMQDWLNTLPANQSELTGNLLAFDSNGNPSKTSPQHLSFTNLDGKETAGSTITLQEFALKYLNDKYTGHMLTANQAYKDAQWYVKINDQLTVGTQRVAFLITKKVGNLTQSWAYCTLLLLPAYKDPMEIYLIQMSTGSDVTFNATVGKLQMTQVGGNLLPLNPFRGERRAA